MKSIFLHGKLRDLIERDFIDIAVSSPAEAVRFLCSVLPGFRKEIYQGRYFLAYDRDGEPIPREFQPVLFGKRDTLHILPDIGGAKAGAGGSGVAPESSAYEDRDDEFVSALFNGAVNTTEQGLCVPVVYGEILAGSAVISAGITAEQVQLGGNYNVPYYYDY